MLQARSHGVNDVNDCKCVRLLTCYILFTFECP